MIGWYALHEHREVRHALQEAFMVECIEIIAGLMQTLETPAIELTGEGFVLALDKVFGYNVLNEELLVVNLPCPTVWLVAHYV